MNCTSLLGSTICNICSSSTDILQNSRKLGSKYMLQKVTNEQLDQRATGPNATATWRNDRRVKEMQHCLQPMDKMDGSEASAS
eukprot:4314583-Pleurochrysis_carterae.AAC.3